ncbi:MAG: copper amine oxidase N-terminal domain-containing protein [Synergistaceae bacterium]|nr:copper amine oxidase N-terminal domain-containing protein [Synergistaceae bacterium]
MLKKIVSVILLIALLTSMLVAPAEIAAIASPEGIVYTNGTLGFSLTLPSSWEGLYSVDERSTDIEWVSFYNIHNKDTDYGGNLFSIAVSNGEHELYPGMKELTREGGKVIYSSTPTDVQFDYTNKSFTDEYQRMESDVENILKTFRFLAPGSSVTQEPTAATENTGATSTTGATTTSDATQTTGTTTTSGATPTTGTTPTTTGATPPTDGSGYIIMQLNSKIMNVNGALLEVDPGRETVPITINDRTMIPARALTEAMNGDVDWDELTQRVTLSVNGNTLIMTLDRNDYTINGVSKTMDVAPVLLNDRTLIPLRFAGEELGCTVDWFEDTKEILVTYAMDASATVLPQTPAPAPTPAPTPTPDPGQSMIPNPMVEVAGADEIFDELGLFMFIPESSENVKYFIISGSLAEVQFELEGIKYSFRVQETNALENISGVYETFQKSLVLEWVDYPYHVAYNEGGAGISFWYDLFAKASYSLYMESGASEAALSAITEFLIPAG